MKKLLKNISLALACVLGLGGVAFAATTQNSNEFTKADAEQPDSAFSTLASITLSDIIANPTGVGDWTWEGSSLVVEDGMIKFTNGDYFQLNYIGDKYEAIERYKGSVHARKPDGTDISWYIWIKTYDTYEGVEKARNGTQHGDANNFKIYQHFFETSYLRIFPESYGGGSEIWIDTLTIEAQSYHAVYATGDEGCKSVYLSTRTDGYRPHSESRDSGTTYYKPGTTVYTFAVMKEGYVPTSNYEAKLSSAADGTEGNLYRITHTTLVGDADYYFDEVETKSLNAKVLIEGTNPGITEVYLSTDADATSGSPSGTGFALNKTVYGFVVLNDEAGYEPQDSWEQLGTTNHYRVGNIQTTDSTDKDLGVFGPKCKINLYNGSELVDTLNVTEGASVNDLIESQIPSKEGYTFIGYYSEPTDGTQYFQKDGKSNINKWQGGAYEVNVYAQYTEDMTVTLTNYEGAWNNNAHGIELTISKPTSGYTLVFESTGTSEAPTYTAPGAYEVNFTITADGYTTYNGQGTVKINKADSILNPVPTGIDGLEYTGNALTLINAGAVDYGTITYACSTTLAVPADSEFDEDLPDRKVVGTYYVFYKTSGDDNHNPIAASIENAIEVKINRIDRTEAIKLNQAVLDYEDILDERFATIENNLELSRLVFEADAITEDNVNAFELSLLIEDMQIKLSEAKVAVTEQLIEAIGTVVYPDSKDAIEEAYDHYTNILNDTEKGMVNAELKALLGEDKVLYDAVDAMAKAINNIPAPAKSQVYYDAVDNTKAAYDNLTEKQLSTLQNATDFNYEKKLLDNVAARKEIELIGNIGDITYNGGVNDSKAPIELAEANYATLTDDQKELVVNYRTLVRSRNTYNNVHNEVELINTIGKVENTLTSKEKIDVARANYNTLKNEEKVLVNGYKNSYKVLDDDEHVYKALVLIDSIGSLAYDTDPEGRIATARKYYDSLTEDQKIQTGERYLNLLVESEIESEHITQVNVTWLIIGLILSVLVIAGGAYYIFTCFRRKKDDDDDDKGSKGKKEPVKAASVGGIFSLIIFTTHYIDAPWIALYIIAPIAGLVLLVCIALFLLRKTNKGPFVKKEEAPAVAEEAPTPIVEESSSDNEEEEVVTITDKAGNRFQIRFIKSFTAKLIQASDETKAYYAELKNEVLSYKKTNSRISWHFDSINAGRNYVIKFGMRGKTLCVYYPLNADDYIDTKYKVEKVEAKKYADVPCLYRINNDRRLGYAKELIALVASNLGLTKGEVPSVNYYLPYEERDPLLARGLIKEIKVSLDKPASEEEEEVVRVVENGVTFEIRFNRSYTAKLIQASDEAKSYYNELKNYILSYKKISDRISWHYESFNSGGNQLIKFGVKGKTLCLYFHLNPNDYQDSKYLVEEVTSKKYEEVPCLYRIKNPRRCNYAKELIDVVMNAYGVNKGEEQHETYELPYEPREPLLARGLIKEVKTKAKEEHRSISVSEADASMSDEAAERRIIDDANGKRHFGKKDIINIDTIGRNFLDNDTVDIEALWEKKLVSRNVGYVKVLARGTLDKKLNINLQEYSIQAVKMILLAGGTVKKAK